MVKGLIGALKRNGLKFMENKILQPLGIDVKYIYIYIYIYIIFEV